nr:DUF3986 family protein [Parageobacillus thermantarcticus]
MVFYISSKFKIFTIDADDLSYEVESKLLEEWLKQVKSTLLCKIP